MIFKCKRYSRKRLVGQVDASPSGKAEWGSTTNQHCRVTPVAWLICHWLG